MPPPNTSRQKKKEDSCETSELFSAATSYFKNRTEDDADVIAKGWALKIRRLAADQRRYAEKIIIAEKITYTSPPIDSRYSDSPMSINSQEIEMFNDDEVCDKKSLK